MGTIIAQDPNSHVNQTFADMVTLANAMSAYGYIPVRPDGTPYVVQNFDGGIIFDGAPLNCYLDGVWYEGQQEAISPHWGKDVPVPSNAIQALPVVPMPSDIAASTAAFNAAQSARSSIPTPLLIAGAVVGFWFITRKKPG